MPTDPLSNLVRLAELLHVKSFAFAVWVVAWLFWRFENLFPVPETRIWIIPVGLIVFFTWLSASVSSLWPFFYREARSLWHKKKEREVLVHRLHSLSKYEANELWAAIQSKSATVIHRPNNTTLASLSSKGFVKIAGEKIKNHNVAFIITDTAWEVINENSQVIHLKVAENMVPEVEIVKN